MKIEEILSNLMEKETKEFTNELGNEITVSIHAKVIDDVDGVMISIIGPTSETTNHITRLEADKLYKTLGKFLRDEHVRCLVDSSRRNRI